MVQMQSIHRVLSKDNRGRGLASAAAVVALGFALLLGGCGHNGQNSTGNGGGASVTTGRNGTSTGSTTTTGNPVAVQDLQSLSDSLSADFSDLASEQTNAITDQTGSQQGVQP
jgi:hypothetical protein